MSAIAVGDKVMITFGDCPHRVACIGEISIVQEIAAATSRCWCGAQSSGPHARLNLRTYPDCWVPLAWLRKIEPDAEVETIEREKALVT